MPKLHRQLRLPDGRTLGYDEHGPSDGAPLFYFHGTPSSRAEFPLFGDEAMLHAQNIRLIAADRPGCGLSDFQPNRRILDWPRDVTALADHLGFDRVSVLGYSGGGVYAAACALAIPERIARAGIVSGAAAFTDPALTEGINPDNLKFFALSHEKPWLSRAVLRMMGVMTRLTPKQVVANALAALPGPDREIVSADPEFQAGFLRMIQEALRHGPRGAQHDTRLMVGEWGFRPQDIEIPVRLWYREADRNVPIAMGRYLARTIPHASATFSADDGHLSMFKKHAEEILGSLRP
jgi:pimeloyl-ACP methyl ester carboxylesterase